MDINFAYPTLYTLSSHSIPFLRSRTGSKGENNRYIFFDANIGVVGFCSKTGIAQLERNDVLDLINLAIYYYSSSGYFREQVPNSCETSILLRDVTLALQEVEEFYSRGNPKQQIVDISVDKQANQLLFTPVSA